MRFAAAPLVVSMALLAVPAFAQNGTTGSNNFNPSNGTYSQSDQYSRNNGTYGNSSQGSNSYNNDNYGNKYGSNESGNNNNSNNSRFANNQNMNQRPGMGITADTQHRLRQSLQQNGFHDIQIMPEAFVIRAQAPDGSRVVMEVSPDMVQGVVENTGSSSNNESNNQSSGHWNPQSGSTNNNMGGNSNH